MLELHTYWRSSASYRVRIALALKGLEAASIVVDLKAGEQRAGYLERNPQGLIPLLSDDGFSVGQSLAILEYLEERFPEAPLLPQDPRERARVRSLAAVVCCDIHPLQNLRVQRYLAGELQASETQVLAWVRHFIDDGLEALEALVSRDADRGAFCVGDTPSLADVCLVPQLYNARRYGCDGRRYPTLLEIDRRCLALPAFAAAAPEAQPEAPPGAAPP